jgi:hypothetical protein
MSAPGQGHVRTLAARCDIAHPELENGFSGGNAIAGTGPDADTGGMDPQIVRYSEGPELWEGTDELFAGIWPEYNQHGQTLNHYWGQLYDVFPQWQFFLCDPGTGEVLAEGHTIPVAWDGSDAGLGPGIDAAIAAGFQLRAAGGQPDCMCALAAEIPARHRGRHLSGVLLQAMSGLAREAGLNHLIAPVRPSLKDRYPTIALERYARWTAPTGRRSTPGSACTPCWVPASARSSPVRCTSPAPPESGNHGHRCGSPRPATTSSRLAWRPSTSTANATGASTGNPTSGSSTRLARRHEGRHRGQMRTFRALALRMDPPRCRLGTARVSPCAGLTG